MALIGLFLVIRSWKALHVAGFSFFTRSAWEPTLGQFGVWAALLGTFLIAIIALVIAVPVAICSALYVTEYAPARLRRPLTSFIDVLAAIPSLIYGLWGRAYLQPRAILLSRWLGTHLGFIPFFKTKEPQSVASYPASTFIAGLVVALMIIPICTAIMREVFSQAPPGEKEGALALGGTKWGVIKTVVLPFGRGGIIGGSMLGLGRARRDDRGHADHLAAVQPALAHARAPDRRELDRVAHRAAVLGVERVRDQRADGRRPDAVRHHARRERARVDRRRAFALRRRDGDLTPR